MFLLKFIVAIPYMIYLGLIESFKHKITIQLWCVAVPIIGISFLLSFPLWVSILLCLLIPLGLSIVILAAMFGITKAK